MEVITDEHYRYCSVQEQGEWANITIIPVIGFGYHFHARIDPSTSLIYDYGNKGVLGPLN